MCKNLNTIFYYFSKMIDCVLEFNSTFYNKKIDHDTVRHDILFGMQEMVKTSKKAYNIDDYIKNGTHGDIALAVVLVKSRIDGIVCYKGPVVTKSMFYAFLSKTFSKVSYVRNLCQMLLSELLVQNRLDNEQIISLKNAALSNKNPESSSWRYQVMIEKPLLNRESFFGCMFGMLTANAVGLVIDGESEKKCQLYANKIVKPGEIPPSSLNFYRFGQLSDECVRVVKMYNKIVANMGVVDSSMFSCGYDQDCLVLAQLGMLFGKYPTGLVSSYIARISSYTLTDAETPFVAIALKTSMASRDIVFCPLLYTYAISNGTLYDLEPTTPFTKALFAFCRHPDSFKDCIAEAIAFGGKNVAYTAAIAGALSGARLGFEKIPVVWRNRVHDMINYNFDSICEITTRVFDYVHGDACKIKI